MKPGSGPLINDAFAEKLPSRLGLTSLNVVRTRVSEAAVERIGNTTPKLKLLPKVDIS